MQKKAVYSAPRWKGGGEWEGDVVKGSETVVKESCEGELSMLERQQQRLR